jgi:hypothetical protein
VVVPYANPTSHIYPDTGDAYSDSDGNSNGGTYLRDSSGQVGLSEYVDSLRSTEM